MEIVYKNLFKSDIEFIPRPEPVLYKNRLTWRLPVLLMVLFNSRGKKSSLLKLNVINTALFKRESQQTLWEMLQGIKSDQSFVLRIDSALTRTIDFAVSYKFVEVDQGKRYCLTAEGEKYIKPIFKDDELFLNEKVFLSNIKSFVTEGRVTELFMP